MIDAEGKAEEEEKKGVPVDRAHRGGVHRGKQDGLEKMQVSGKTSSSGSK